MFVKLTDRDFANQNTYIHISEIVGFENISEGGVLKCTRIYLRNNDPIEVAETSDEVMEKINRVERYGH